MQALHQTKQTTYGPQSGEYRSRSRRLCQNHASDSAWTCRLKRNIRGFKSCRQDRRTATVVAIELLLKGFAGARNQLYRPPFTWWRPDGGVFQWQERHLAFD
jgi:hypothetical protein